MRLACLALVLLASCGGGSGGPNETPDGLDIGPPPTASVYVVVVPPGYFADARLAEFDLMNGDGWIRVREDILANPDLTRRVIRHELGHALGLAHSPDASCVMHTDAFQNPALVLCPAEVAFAQSLGFTLAVYLQLTPGIAGPTSDACDEWSAAHGGTILAVQ